MQKTLISKRQSCTKTKNDGITSQKSIKNKYHLHLQVIKLVKISSDSCHTQLYWHLSLSSFLRVWPQGVTCSYSGLIKASATTKVPPRVPLSIHLYVAWKRGNKDRKQLGRPLRKLNCLLLFGAGKCLGARVAGPCGSCDKVDRKGNRGPGLIAFKITPPAPPRTWPVTPLFLPIRPEWMTPVFISTITPHGCSLVS